VTIKTSTNERVKRERKVGLKREEGRRRFYGKERGKYMRSFSGKEEVKN
jgi:hypothetical protein